MLSVSRLFRIGFSLLALLATGLTTAGTAQQNGWPREQLLSQDVRCVLKVDNFSWQPGKPAQISVRLENLTDRDLEFETLPELDLSSYRGDYWAPTDIVENKPIKTRSVDINGLEPVPIKMRLAKNSVSVFQIDAANTLWARTISSLWPSGSLYTVPPGSYSLRLKFSIGGSLVRSNDIKIVIEKKDPT